MGTFQRYPFSAMVGQDKAKLAFILSLINSKAGGLLLSGKKGVGKSLLVRSAESIFPSKKVFTVPLSITEDMLFGSIDIPKTLLEGKKCFTDGIIGRAKGHLICIDDVNLLPNVLLSALLDVNLNGKNIVEREGISFEEAVSYTVVGTMNPEEGELPKHILDRFGMCVNLKNEDTTAKRVEIMKKVLQYEKNSGLFIKKYQEEDQAIGVRIRQARDLLTAIEVPEAILVLAAQLSAECNCQGHRAEIFLIEAAKALAGFNNRNYVLPKDLYEVAPFVLLHRTNNEAAFNDKAEDDLDNADEQNQEKDQEEEPDLDNVASAEAANDNAPANEEENQKNENAVSQDGPNKENDNALAADEKNDKINRKLHLGKLVFDLQKDRVLRKGSGKRSLTRTSAREGRYVKSFNSHNIKNTLEDLAFDATIRAAAPYQKIRGCNGHAINIQKEDFRKKVREKRIGKTFLFAVDASGSMGAKKRMAVVKTAIFQMLQEAYEKRDRVSLVAFRRTSAEMILPVTRSVELAEKLLSDLSTGGKTPLAEGIETSYEMLNRMNKKDKNLEPIFVLVTDGRANYGENALQRAEASARLIAEAHITSVVLDTESDYVKLGGAGKIARAMGANYFKLSRLTKEEVLKVVRSIKY